MALAGYLDSYGLAFDQDGNKIVVNENREPVLTATFDELNRLTNLEVRLESEAAEESETWNQAQLRGFGFTGHASVNLGGDGWH